MSQTEVSTEALGLSSLFSGIASLFKSNDILDTLIETRDRIQNTAIPAVGICIADTKTISFANNPEYKTGIATINRRYHKANQKELFPALGVILTDAEKIMNQLIPLVGKYFTETVDKDSITYPRAQIMALAENIDFIADFIPSYCRYIIALQTQLNNGPKIEESLTKAQIKYIKENLLNFYKALDALSGANVKSVEQMLRDIPNVNISDDNKESQLFSKLKLDPTGALNNFLSARTNPFYYIRMAMVDYQHARYKRAKEEVEAIKIDLDYLSSQIQNGSGDAYLERQKELAQERLSKLEFDIAKYEEKARNTRY